MPNSFGRPAFGWQATYVGADAREVLDERPHLLRAERAVDAHDERLRVLDRPPERLDGLPREVAAAHVDRGEGEPEWKVRRGLLRRDDRGLRVERVEDRLDQEDVHAAFGQRGDLLGVGLPHLVERDRAIRGVVDLRRERQRDVERPDRAGDETAELVGDAAREARTLEAHLARVLLEGVVRLPDSCGGERVRRRDVRAGLEVAPVDVEHDLRPREVEQVGVAGDVARMVAEPLAAIRLLPAHVPLDQHAPRTVEHPDPIAEEGVYSVSRVHQRHRLRPTARVA